MIINQRVYLIGEMAGWLKLKFRLSIPQKANRICFFHILANRNWCLLTVSLN